jgi:hypothetical protein
MHYFSNCTLLAGGKLGEAIPPNQKLPEALVSQLEESGELAKLLERKRIKAVDTSAHIAKVAPKTEKPGLWKFNPAETATKPVDVLNMMIQDHIAKHGLAPVATFTALDEAVAFMAQDL